VKRRSPVPLVGFVFVPDTLPDRIDWMDTEARIDSWVRTLREILSLPETKGHSRPCRPRGGAAGRSRRAGAQSP
jgi:hypothetical protein